MIEICEYSPKSFAVIGNTRPYKETIKRLGGRWNPNLTIGKGWIFQLTKLPEVEAWLTTIDYQEPNRQVIPETLSIPTIQPVMNETPSIPNQQSIPNLLIRVNRDVIISEPSTQVVEVIPETPTDSVSSDTSTIEDSEPPMKRRKIELATGVAIGAIGTFVVPHLLTMNQDLLNQGYEFGYEIIKYGCDFVAERMLEF